MPHPKLTPAERRGVEALIHRLERLKQLGEFSDSELARAAGLNQTTVSAWFRDRNAPLGHVLARLPKALSRPHRKVNGHWLLTGEGEMYLGDDHETSPESYVRGAYAVLAEIEEALRGVRERMAGRQRGGGGGTTEATTAGGGRGRTRRGRS
jgi:transcriptional regulator with XRE-family HTH domain